MLETIVTVWTFSVVYSVLRSYHPAMSEDFPFTVSAQENSFEAGEDSKKCISAAFLLKDSH
jgi:hypothetical protein